MKNFHTIMSIFAGTFFLIYDLWMIQSGHLPVVTMMVALVGWMGLVLMVSSRRQRSKRRQSAARSF